MEYEISNLSQAVEGIQEDEAVGSSYFESCVQYVGRELASQVLPFFQDQAIYTIRIVCSVEDYELLAVPFASAANDLKIKTAISCLWSIYEKETEYVPAKSVLVSQAHGDGPDRVDILLVISSSFSEPAVVADHFSRASNATAANFHLAITPFETLDAINSVVEELEVRSSIQPEFITLSEDNELDIDLSQRIRQHLVRVYGRIGTALLPRDFGGTAPLYDNDYQPPRYII